MGKTGKKFHEKVAEYYDKDAELGFEERAETNPLLEKIRNDFRSVTVKYPFLDALEIGCGPGLDLEWFASQFPERKFEGIDISPTMVELAEKRISKGNLDNAKAAAGNENDLLKKFAPGQFDLIYVYFGALNTVENLRSAARVIRKLLAPGGHVVLTFVNKWYLREMLVQTLKMKFSIAFARLKNEWGGYSPDRYLPSRCYSPADIVRAFSEFHLLERKGYSIFFPAWYNYKKYLSNPEKADKLWAIDQKIQRTFLWSKGEYTLFVFRSF